MEINSIVWFGDHLTLNAQLSKDRWVVCHILGNDTIIRIAPNSTRRYMQPLTLTSFQVMNLVRDLGKCAALSTEEELRLRRHLDEEYLT